MDLTKIYDEQFWNLLDINDTDEKILQEILKNKETGTIKLSKIVGIAPKNLIVHLKKLELAGLIKKGKIKLKPKGWKRIFILDKYAQLYLDMKEKAKINFEDIMKDLVKDMQKEKQLLTPIIQSNTP